MRVLLADDHDLVREAIAAYLESAGEFQVTLAGALDEAIGEIERSGAFDLVMLDLNMPGMNGLDGLAKAIDANQGKPVALISGDASKTIAEAALAAGAAGFVPKTLTATSMINAARFMAAGEQFAPVKWMAEAGAAPENPLSAALTDREREVLERLCQGASNKEIARDLSLQEVTVKLHVKTLCRKLDARNRTQAAMIARDAGLF